MMTWEDTQLLGVSPIVEKLTVRRPVNCATQMPDQSETAVTPLRVCEAHHRQVRRPAIADARRHGRPRHRQSYCTKLPPQHLITR